MAPPCLLTAIQPHTANAPPSPSFLFALSSTAMLVCVNLFKLFAEMFNQTMFLSTTFILSVDSKCNWSSNPNIYWVVIFVSHGNLCKWTVARQLKYILVYFGPWTYLLNVNFWHKYNKQSLKYPQKNKKTAILVFQKHLLVYLCLLLLTAMSFRSVEYLFYLFSLQ